MKNKLIFFLFLALTYSQIECVLSLANCLDEANRTKNYFKFKKLVATTLKEEINKQNKDGNTALMRAVILGDKELVKILLEFGADISIKNKIGKIPLDLCQGFKQYIDINDQLDYKFYYYKEISKILQVEASIYDDTLKYYLKNLELSDLLWIIERAITNPRLKESLTLEYKIVVDTYISLKSSSLDDQEIIDILRSYNTNFNINSINSRIVHEKLMNDLFKVLILHKMGMNFKSEDLKSKIYNSNYIVIPKDVAAKIVLEF